ncbi:unnamed protein product [Penicillium nalgiovense]|nr:unnamed protein product [Penicillium nalgiovense]CAG8323041.1 unnamed protein product [Penicillium nalgiovense]
MAKSLPLETLQEIFSYQTGRLASCACVCRQWQLAAERFTFADLHISSADLEDFRQMFPVSNSAGRRFHLRSLHFKINLPKYGIAARGQYEDQYDRDTNSNVFTQAITSLFKILSSWPEYDRYMSLQIYARSPSSDWQAEPDWTTRRARLERGRAFPEEELLQRRYQDSYLQLRGKIALRDVKCITSLDVMGCDNFRNIAPGAVSEMVVHLPRLQTVTATLRDKVRNGPEMGDSDSLGDYSPHSTPGPNSRSLALQQIIQQLENVDLTETTIGPDLFWPVDANHTTPFWPNLIKLTIMYSSNSASRGQPPDLTDEQLQTPLKSKDLDELSLAAGRAAQHMPRLQSMEIDLSLPSVPTAHYYFIYIATLGKVPWAVTSQFYVSKKTQQVWDVAARRHGNSLPSVEVCDMDTYSSDSSSFS